jgi:hypothetical protein
MSDPWPFEDPPNLAVITLKRILQAEQPIRYVSHDLDDGGWEFLDGGDVREVDAMVVGLKEIMRFDPTIGELADLPLGWNLGGAGRCSSASAVGRDRQYTNTGSVARIRAYGLSCARQD